MAAVDLGMARRMELEEFRIVARQSGLPFTEQEVAVLHEGYAKLERMLAGMGGPRDPAAAPAVVFRPAVMP